jgi:tetratricopeptide (TPR) repeat protein
VKIKNGILILLLAVALSPFLFGGSCLESPSAMWVGIAKGQAGRGEYDKAIVSFNTALEKSPNSWYVYLNRGEFYLKIERYEEAAADFTRVIELYPKIYDSYRVYTERGDCYRKLMRYITATADYDRALGIRPNYAPALFGRGLTYWESNRRDEALADLGRACGLKYEAACEKYKELAAQPAGGGAR